ncbi:hypothetical protein, partial [Paraburkholderia phosphatilytica]|uniref:hypothetical protein n=1 Tax=Paraburkholderia phosphatilytica TaxID=2282883 RepID=UPI001980ECC9
MSPAKTGLVGQIDQAVVASIRIVGIPRKKGMLLQHPFMQFLHNAGSGCRSGNHDVARGRTRTLPCGHASLLASPLNRMNCTGCVELDRNTSISTGQLACCIGE